MGSLLKSLLSIKIAVFLLFMFAIASGVATFIENDFGSQGSRAVVYNTGWFAAIQVYLAVLIVYNMYKHNVFKTKSLPAFIFHIAFVVILIGAGMTRYLGYEGIMHIREGQTENRVLSSKPFIMANATKDNKIYSVSKNKIFSAIGSNDFSMNLNVAGEKATIKYKKFIPNAITQVVEDSSGTPMVSMLVTSGGRPDNVVLKNNDYFESENVLFTLNNNKKNRSRSLVKITIKDGKFYFTSNRQIGWFRMLENKRGTYEANKEYEFVGKQLYTIGGTNFAPKFIGLKGKSKIVTNPSRMQRRQKKLSALIVDVTYKGKTKEAAVYGSGGGSKGFTKTVNVAGTNFNLEWGSKVLNLPFEIKLNDFQLDRYPGSHSPMSYASEVEVINKANNIKMPYRIFMNHVLDYQGYRFFQSSYDQDELGTILSVNKDPGKWPTYIGYMLLALGLFLNLINPNSRFRKLSGMIQRDMVKVKSVLVAFLMVFGLLHANNAYADAQSALAFLKKYDVNHAQKFSNILVQSEDGRIEPIDTVSTEVLHKVYRSSSYKGMTANQVILSMMASPEQWQIQPMIHVFHPQLKKVLGMSKNQKNATFNDFFEQKGNHAYKLGKYAEEANRKKPMDRTKFDKAIIKVDEKVNIVYMVYTGELFKMIPKIGDPNHKWYSPKAAISTFPKSESDDVKNLLSNYFDALAKGLKKGQWDDANKAVDKIMSYQEQYGSDIIPSPSRISAEKFFNKAGIFEKLTPIYLLSGLVLLFAIFAKMLKPSISIKWISKIVFVIIILSFGAHIVGLGLRWYVTQHAPWTNGYESMIYIAWAIIFAGILFSRHSILTVALTAILSGVTLFVAHLSWMDPQMTTLVPVLHSYWLNIHVSVIASSYGFFGLCGLLGFFTLILFSIKSKDKNSKRNIEIDRNIVEATRINEMAMIFGLSLLSVGNFLGGVWANESWGRYWGWDPKETWALVSILIYAAVLHFRFIKALSTQFVFAVASTLAFASIIMTYFGVNYYLSGMHSYASGDPVPIPVFVYYTVAIVFSVIALAYRNRGMSKKL